MRKFGTVMRGNIQDAQNTIPKITRSAAIRPHTLFLILQRTCIQNI